MQNSGKYPSRFEIEQALSEFCKRGFLDNFAQKRGIFIAGAIQSELAHILSSFFFEYKDIEAVRAAAFHVHSRSTISGFILHSKEDGFNLIGLLDDLRSSLVDEKREMRLGQLIQLEIDDKAVYQGHVDYVYKKPGRIEFLQEDSRSFEYYVQETKEGEWKVLVDCNRSTDARVMEDWIKRKAGREVEFLTIDDDLLSSSESIRFFDELARKGMPYDWYFTKVKHLILRRGLEDEEEVEKSELSGITQAILEGNDLRDNPFVKQSEESGYRFTAMTFEYEHKTKPYILQIRAEFKGRPKVFEVELKSSKERVGTEEKLEDLSLKPSDELRISSDFWARAKEVFDELRRAKKSE